MVADLVDRRAGEPVGEVAALLLDEQRLQTGRARLVVLGVARAHEHLDEVGGLGVAAPALVPGDHPLVAVAYRAGLHAGEVGAGVGLGQRDRADPVPRADAASSSALRASSASPVPRPCARAMMLATLIHARASSSATMQYSKAPRPRPPCSRGIGDAEVAELGHPRQQRLAGSALLRVELVRDRQHLVARERARLLHAGFALRRCATAAAARAAPGSS